MVENQLRNTLQNILSFSKNHRILSLFIISLIFTSSVVTIVLISLILPLFSIPDFSVNSFNIKSVEEGTVYADFNFNFSSPVKSDIAIKKIKIKLYQENYSEKLILAEGYSLQSFSIKKNEIMIENISFLFEVPIIEDLMEVLLEEEKIGITGTIFFPIGFSIPFSYEPKDIGGNILPSLDILEAHPVPPGSILEILVSLDNPHDITLNLTKGTFDLIEPEYGTLGNVSLPVLSIPSKLSNITMQLQTETEVMTWLFEKILNNGSIQAEIQNFEAIFMFGENKVNLSMEKGPNFTWGSFDPSLDVIGFSNVSTNYVDIISFDVGLVLYGNPLWGYNISAGSGNQCSISLDFYYVIENELQMVGNGSTNVTVTVNRNEMALFKVHINVLPFAVAKMILNWNFEIDIRNGKLSLQFYDVSLDIDFERQIGI